MLESRWPSLAVRRGRRISGAAAADLLRQVALPAAATLAGAAFIAWYTLQVRDWAVMTDELLYAKLATAVADTGSPLPSIHGEYVRTLSQLYPLVLAPIYAAFDVPTAFRVAHAVNAMVMASAAIPIYLLARTLVPRAAAAAVAVAGIVTPWALLAGFLMSEVAAYPAFAWAILAIQRTVERPSRRADALALAALAVAFFARTQLLVLALVLPLAIVAHELGYAAASERGRHAVAEAARRSADRHGVLLAAYAAGAAVAVVAAAVGSVAGLLGSYAVTVTEGPLFPPGVWKAAVAHLDAVALGVGTFPLLLGVAWALATLVQPSAKDAHAFAVVAMLTLAALSIQTASYDLRFGVTEIVRDRYVFYVAPLLLIAAAAWLLDERPRPLVLLAVTAAFAVSVRWYEFHVVDPFTVDSPVSLLNERIVEYAGDLAPATFVGIVAGLVAVTIAAARTVVSQRLLAGVALGVLLALGAATTGDAFERVLDSTGPSGRLVRTDPGADKAWVDEALHDEAEAAIVPFAGADWEASAARWWDTEFWNASVTRAFVAEDGRFSFTPFSVDGLALDRRRGRVRAARDDAEYFVVATHDVRFRLAGARKAASDGLELLAAERPHRVEWATEGLDADGWLRPSRPGVVRVFARPGAGAEVAALDVVLKAPLESGIRYRIVAEGTLRPGSAPADAAVVERLELCVPAAGYAEARIVTDFAAVIPESPAVSPDGGSRRVGARLESVTLERTERACE